ncbi:MAG: N-acetylglucosamine kinase [Cyclobacteriaceae bacterium]|nr:N-acetylglucosamine kinase [Cyclobacteriaceae bacterium]
MIIIADSGSSKIDWRLLNTDKSIRQASSPGFNPYYQPIDHLKKAIQDALVPVVNEKVKAVYFYGTGVSSKRNQELVRDVFLSFFPEAAIEIEWDLLAAARALCGDEKGIACILGTGSNSCLYDGRHITDQVANLGWILADEGSGTSLGKKLLFDYLRKKMPETLAGQFQKRFPFSREEFLQKVYQDEKPSTFLATFSHFLFQHLKEPYCYRLAYESMAEFFENNVMGYAGYRDLKVHFVGSIAFYYSDLVRQVANDKGIIVKNILETPIAGLTLFHQKDVQ